MKIRSYEVAVFCAGAYLLLGALGFGQTEQAQKTNNGIKPRDAQTGMASGRREVQSGQASGKATVTGEVQPVGKSPGSAHAVEPADATTGPANQQKMSGAQSNPLYKGSTKGGENPLYEGKDRTAKPNGSSDHDVMTYKDPEDMTIRHRPGNNKTTRATDSSEKKGGAPQQ
jgi:hypothetical protein